MCVGCMEPTLESGGLSGVWDESHKLFAVMESGWGDQGRGALPMTLAGDTVIRSEYIVSGEV